MNVGRIIGWIDAACAMHELGLISDSMTKKMVNTALKRSLSFDVEREKALTLVNKKNVSCIKLLEP